MKKNTSKPISIVKIQSVYDSLSASEKRISDYFSSHLEAIVYLTVTAVAQATKTSEATVVRTCRRLGYGGFQDFKITVAQEIVNPVKTIFEEADVSDDCYAIFNKKIGNAISTLQYTSRVIDKDQIENAAQKIIETERIVFFGSGNSASIAMDGAHKFMRAGKNSSSFSDSHMQIIAAAGLKKGDVAIGISHSGSSRNVVEALKVAKKSGAVTIAITNYSRSPITEAVDIILYTASEETKYHVISLSSRLAQLAIIDTLYIYTALRNQSQSLELMNTIDKALQTKKY